MAKTVFFSGKCCAEDFLLEKDCFLAENGNRNGRENNGRKSGWLRTCLFFCVGLSIVRQCEERNALAGIILCFCNLKEHSNLETICYIAMGCSIFVGFKPLCQHVPPAFIYWLIGEGVSYITGAVFYSFPKLPYMHSVFHLFVLGGTVCHMMALWYIL